MRSRRAYEWVERYLFRAYGYRALEQSVLAAGERAGFSERALRRAGRELGVLIFADAWELPSAHVQRLVEAELSALTRHEPVLTPTPQRPLTGLGASAPTPRH
jgi:hypothetical protein